MLALSPTGRLYVLSPQNKDDSSVASQNSKIHAAFRQEESVGLLCLAAAKPADNWPGSLHFWHDFGAGYAKALCQISPEVTADAITLPPPENKTFERLVLSMPPMPGAEYCTQAVFSRLWKALNAFVQTKMRQDGDDISHFLHRYLPAWRQVGRVCFHLAENKQDPDRPFAFLATYASHVGKNAKVQYLPLSRALQEYAGAGNKAALVRLLKPIHTAAQVCPWVDSLLKQHDIYHPLRWPSRKAYRLLKSVPHLEASGITVRLPDWWKKRPRAQVRVSIGSKKQSMLDMEAILDFNVSVVFDGKTLTKEEIQQLLSSDGELVSLRGQWVEVDKDKLRAAIKHWKQVEQDTKSGLSFAEGMRLLSGSGQALSPGEAEEFDDESGMPWAYVDAGDWLRDVLAKLRDPALLAQRQPKELSRVTLRPYQQQGLSWLYFLNQLGLGACLADDMGLGKTVQILALLLLRKQLCPQKTGCSLLVLPASLLSNWSNELARFAPTLRVIALHPSETNRSLLDQVAESPSMLADYDLAMTTYSTVWRQTWFREYPWDILVLDEAQAIKNPAAKQTQRIKALRSKTRIALTGTPIENRLSDLWSLFDFLCPGLLGSMNTFKGFIKALDEKKRVNYEPLRKLVRPYILRRLKTDKRIISDLPDKTEMVVRCGLTSTQTKLYAQAVGELKNILKNQHTKSVQRKGLVLSYLMRFKQICNHPDQMLGQGNYAASQSGKFTRLGELCEEIHSRQEKVLVFTQFQEMARPLALFLETVFQRQGVRLHGGTPVKEREKRVKAFQTEQGPPFFVLSLKAGGTGLNLTAANHVIHFDRWWNPAVENQATDRAFRIGQKRNVLVHKFICQGTIEDSIDALIAKKIQLSSELLSNDQGPLLTELSDDELLSLVALDLKKARI